MSKWYDIGTVRVKEVTKDGKKSKSSYLVLNEKVEILVDGKKVDLGKYRTIKFQDALSGFKTAVENGNMTQEKFEDIESSYTEKGVKYRATIPPASID